MLCSIISGATGGVLLLPMTASAGLNANGSFDDTTGAFNPNYNAVSDPGAMNVLAGDSTTIPGWTVLSTSPVAWINSANAYGLTAAPGNGSDYFLDLTGWQDAKPFGGVSTTINTVSGQTYQVAFRIGSSTTHDSGVPGIELKISGVGAAGSKGVAYYVSQSQLSGANKLNARQQFVVDFTAGSGPLTTLYFKGLINGSGQTKYIGLDNVSVTDVPEPTTMVASIGGLGLALLGVFGSRRSSVIKIGK